LKTTKWADISHFDKSLIIAVLILYSGWNDQI